jgi:hypothetical protein
MMNWKTMGAVAALTLAAAGAQADDRAGRYTMSPTDDGFIRLDTQSGAMSLCSRKTGSWACEALPGGQQPSASELEKLKAENKDLKDQVARLEESLGIDDPNKPGATPPPPNAGPENRLELPSEQDIDKAFDYLESVFRKFRERIKKFEDEDKKETPL